MNTFWNGTLFGAIAVILPSLILFSIALHSAPDISAVADRDASDRLAG